jgi:murein DD-endopeptidase MepM/ murein hydrolase activator NlpD
LKLTVARIGLYSVVALAFAGALRFTPMLPDAEQRPVEDILSQAGAPASKLHFDTLARGETLQGLLRRGGLSDIEATHALQAATMLDERRVPAGMPVTIRSEAADSAPSEVTLQLSIDRILRLRRTGTTWVGSEERLPWVTDTILVAGRIASNLYVAVDSSTKNDLPSAARQQLTYALADVYEYRVDMSRDLQQGDEFRVMAERSVGPSGAVRIGKVLSASFKLSGTLINAFRFSSASVNGDFFDQDGKSMRAAFLRAPLEFRRISSVFGGREHPILGGWRMHKGLDYSANAGTPVRAIGDGVVIKAGWGNGYGNMVEIRHRNGFVTRYGHLRAFASKLHVGSRVTISETIAYVGSTGLSTGPHLHFEVLVDGVQRDPRTALKRNGGDPVPAAERLAFDSLRTQLLASLETPTTGVTKLATTTPAATTATAPK